MNTWPDGREFAFTIVDDTDHSTEANTRPVYDLLDRLGLRTTKTVWVFRSPPGDPWAGGETLEDPGYRRFVTEIRDAGFEIALHGVRGTSSPRDLVVAGLQLFCEIVGRPPRIHVNHSKNLDNVHWGADRLPSWRRRLHLHGAVADPSFGHHEGSEYFWGDLCRQTMTYVRGRCFRGLDTLAADPFMPYHEPRFPYVNLWFSCSDGSDPDRFVRLLSEENLSRLRRRRGLAIIYTHFGAPGFVDPRGQVAAPVRDRLEALSRSQIWCRPVGEVLDHLRGAEPRTLGPLQQLRIDWRARRDRPEAAG